MKVWSKSESLGASNRNSWASLSKEEIYRETIGVFTELAGNLEMLGLENREEPREAGQLPTGQKKVTETPSNQE